MSQPRVTDFFSRSKRAAAAPRRASKPRTRSSIPASDCSSVAVHQEFLRVIEEAVGSKPAKELCAQVSPKRSAADSTFDLGAALFSASTEHCTAKKRRPADPKGPTHSSDPACKKKAARKKLVLLGDGQQDVAHPLPPEQPCSPAEPSTPQNQDHGNGDPGRVSMDKDNLSSLKARLQKIKNRSDDLPNTTNQTTPPARTGHALKLRLARAKELAAKAQRRKEEQEAADGEESKEQPEHRSETPPSYQLYHSLAQAGPPTLCLPYTYRVLAEMFRSMDTVVAMLYNRRQTPTFTTIKQGVQDMMHRRFEEVHVAQIKNVFPEAFVFRQEKNIPTFSSSMKKKSYQLTVEPLLPATDQSDDHPILSASQLLERRRTFHCNLLAMVKQHHKDFLLSLVPPLSVPEDQLTRWHPRFKVDSVPPVQASTLPQAPATERTVTAQEVLDKARSLITPKMEKALVSLTHQTPDVLQTPDVPQTSTSPAVVPPALRGVSQCLLDRIRAKEAQKLQAAMTRDPQVEERLVMMSRLAELARIVRSVFVSEKKPALIMEVVCNRMVDSYRSAMTTGEMEKHVRLLSELAPDWLSLVQVRKDSYLKLNRNMELTLVLDRLTHRQKQEELVC